ncbi:hypothetical protein ACHQM5_012100 [Ranunculus cassubicifolius]
MIDRIKEVEEELIKEKQVDAVFDDRFNTYICENGDSGERMEECWIYRYFNYMGMLAVEGTYDKMEALLSQNIHPVDILLLMAASEGDLPKIEELLRAGANYTVADGDGRTALDRAATDEIKQYILGVFCSESVKKLFVMYE